MPFLPEIFFRGIHHVGIWPFIPHYAYQLHKSVCQDKYWHTEHEWLRVVHERLDEVRLGDAASNEIEYPRGSVSRIIR